jgi:hypothetical protein
LQKNPKTNYTVTRVSSLFNVLHALGCKTHQDFRRKIYAKHILFPSEAQIHNILQMGSEV